MEADTKITRSDAGCDQYITVPPVDIYEENDRFVLKADMPGVSKERLDITLDNQELTIAGSIDKDQLTDALQYSEFNLHDYKRTFIVHDEIDSKGITAALENGVLTLTLPKSEKAKPRKIDISVH